MKKSIWLLLPLIFFLCAPASAEYYKYIDKDGNVRFTDDLSTVPENQRPGAIRYEESQQNQNSPPADKKSPKTSQPSSEKDPKKEISIEAMAKQIKQKRDQLDKEYKALENEKARLEKEQNTTKTVNETKAFNREIKELNEKRYQWDQKRNAFNAELDSYNARLAEQIKKKK